MVAKSAFPTIPDFSFKPFFAGSLCRDLDVLRGVQPDVCAVQRTLLEGKSGLVLGIWYCKILCLQAKAQLPLSLEAFPEVCLFSPFGVSFLVYKNKTVISVSCDHFHLYKQILWSSMIKFSFCSCSHVHRYTKKWADRADKEVGWKLRKQIDWKYNKSYISVS